MPERAIDALPMPAAYLRQALRLFGGTPERNRRLLAGTGIDPASASSVSSSPATSAVTSLAAATRTES